ncbi:MAG: Phage integrase [Blastococcus sp.]|jgi:integrase|nr:Phage integrase [Blastococcus sp.]
MFLRGPRVHCYFPAGTPSLRPTRAHRTVLRRGEALALRWPDVDLERGALRIRGTLRIDGRLLVTEPETAEPKRFVPISVQARPTRRPRQRPPGPGSRRGPAPAPALGGRRDAHARAPLEVVSEILGHSSIAITRDVYGHVASDVSRDTIATLAAVLGGQA